MKKLIAASLVVFALAAAPPAADVDRAYTAALERAQRNPDAPGAMDEFLRLSQQKAENDLAGLRAKADRLLEKVEAKKAKIRQLTAELDTEREDLLLLYADYKVLQSDVQRDTLSLDKLKRSLKQTLKP
jgi:hypothetical protein